MQVLGGTLLGLATGLCYPTLIAAIADHFEPEKRAQSIGVYRFHRDLGYAAGALIAVFADSSRPETAILVSAALTLVTGLLVSAFYRERKSVV